MLSCKPGPSCLAPTTRGGIHHHHSRVAAGCTRPRVAAPESSQKLSRKDKSNKRCGMLSPQGKGVTMPPLRTAAFGIWGGVSGKASAGPVLRTQCDVWETMNHQHMLSPPALPATNSQMEKRLPAPRSTRTSTLHTSWRCTQRQQRPIPRTFCSGPPSPAIP